MSRSRLPLPQRVRQDPAAIRYWLLVTTAALVLATGIGHVVGRAESVRAGWGRTEVVHVLTRRVRAGDSLDHATTEARWPSELLPDAVVRRLPPGSTATSDLDAGAPLTSALIDTPGAPGADDRRTIAVPLGEAALPLRRGDRVDVWATVDPSLLADGKVATRRVATDARIVAVGDGATVVQVTTAQVAPVADAAATAIITLVGRG